MTPRFFRKDAKVLREKIWQKYSAIDLETNEILRDRKHQGDVLCHVDIELTMCFYIDDEEKDEFRKDPGWWSKNANQRFINLLAWLALRELGLPIR